MRRTILLLRHFESLKNVEDRHGGDGQGLTYRGIQQGLSLVRYINENFFVGQSSSALYGHDVVQIKDSVEILSKGLGLHPIWDERLRGINLGLLAGFSREEASHKYPDAAQRLELWRQGRLRADELNLPGGEDFSVFENRIRLLLESWIHSGLDPIIAVCSRSTLIMFVNLIQLGEKFNYSSYKVFEFASASITEILVNANGEASLGRINETLD